MAETLQFDVEAGRRHIIKRPRLTRLLDASTARIILLIAPAGYGKTTLAREWLEQGDRRSAWYRGGPASADVAALAVGLAEAASTIVPGAGQRMRDRLRVTNAPSEEVRVLAELLAEDLAKWPPDAWLAIDDYHYLGTSPAAEQFVERITGLPQIRSIVTSRRRPKWAVARRILYGEVTEIGRNALAMNTAEAGTLLAGRRQEQIPGLIALADGWPAVLGLAALTEEFSPTEHELPTTLYDYLAEELFDDRQKGLQWNLAQLALAPSLTTELASFLFGNEARRTLTEGARIGALTADPAGIFEIHPLLATFLRRKLAEHPKQREDVAIQIGDFLITNRAWDQAFALIEAVAPRGLLEKVIKAATFDLLADGRSSTLRKWLDLAESRGVASPSIDLAEAELAFRGGRYERSRALALQVSVDGTVDDETRAHALCLAGEAAHQLDLADAAIELHSQALAFAKTFHLRRRAAWGRFLSALQLETPNLREMFDELSASLGKDADGALQMATARLLLASRVGDVPASVGIARSAQHLLDRGTDLKIRVSFVYLFANALMLDAYYDEALRWIATGRNDADTYRLDYITPFSRFIEGATYVGLHDYSAADRCLRDAGLMAADREDYFLLLNVRAVQARLALAKGAARHAVALTEIQLPRLPGPGIRGEVLATKALALACLGDLDRADSAAAEATAMTSSIEAHTLASCTRAIASLQRGAAGTAQVETSFRLAVETGTTDLVVAAYRGFPGFLKSLASLEALRTPLLSLVQRSHDLDLASSAGLPVAPTRRTLYGEPLSPRELTVLALVAEGRTNREIAQRLFISEVTVKVHVRHILQKLGVRSRIEAAFRYREMPAS